MRTGQQDEIQLSRKMQRYGVRRGDRRVFWVSYPGMYGLPCREIYPTAKQARERAIEIMEQRAALGPLSAQAVRVTEGV